MTRQQQLALRRAWGRCLCDLDRVRITIIDVKRRLQELKRLKKELKEEFVSDETRYNKNRLKTLMEREEILTDDIAVFQELIDWEDEEFTVI